MKTIVPMEDMYRKMRGVPPIVGYPSVGEVLGKVEYFGLIEIFQEPVEKLLGKLEIAGVQIEHDARKVLLKSRPPFKNEGKEGYVAVDLIKTTLFSYEENHSYEKIFSSRAPSREFMPCINYIAPYVALFYASRHLELDDPYVVFARNIFDLKDEEDSVLLTLEIKSRTWGGVTLGAVNGALDFVAPGRKYIFAKKYTRF